MEIRLGQCGYHSNVPSYGFAALPRNQGDAIGMPAVKSCQAGWLFGSGNAS